MDLRKFVLNGVLNINFKNYLSKKKGLFGRFFKQQKIEVVIPEGVTEICEGAFADCNEIESVVLPSTLKKLPKNLFLNCKSLHDVVIPEGVVEIGESAFENCNNLESVVLPKSLQNIEDYAFLFSSINNLEIPENVKKIGKSAFSNVSNCVVKSKNLTLARNAFDLDGEFFKLNIDLKLLSALNFNKSYYIYITKNDENVHISYFINNDLLKDSLILNMTQYDLHDFNNYQLEGIVKELRSKKIVLPVTFLKLLLTNDKFYDFMNNSSFKSFANEFKNVDIYQYKPLNVDAIYLFAYITNCFSKEKLKDIYGTETNIAIAQKSSSNLANMLKKDILTADIIYELIKHSTLEDKASDDFINFFYASEDNYSNARTLLKLIKFDGEKFINIMRDFDTIKNLKIGYKSWKKAIQKYIELNPYKGVTEENMEIATLFFKAGMKQSTFDYAVKLKDKVKFHKPQKSILKKALVEDISNIIEKTKQELINSQDELKTAYDEIFSYELLDKDKPENLIIGHYCDCCCTIDSVFYGCEISENTYIKNDYQNLVVKDKNGLIIGKASMFVDRKSGYVVLNEFDIDKKYKQDEKLLDHSARNGEYKKDGTSKAGKIRDKIFNTFMRGLKAFVEEYDKENPTKPIKQINVGMGFNKLKRQCYEFKLAENEKFIEPPEEFRDAQYEQYILYERNNEKEM